MALAYCTVAARGLRRDATYVERRLWHALRAAALPWKLRRQHPIGRRVVDFTCPSCKLAIELDGGQPDTLTLSAPKIEAERDRRTNDEAHPKRCVNAVALDGEGRGGGVGPHTACVSAYGASTRPPTALQRDQAKAMTVSVLSSLDAICCLISWAIMMQPSDAVLFPNWLSPWMKKPKRPNMVLAGLG
jgi:hypothetical protein